MAGSVVRLSIDSGKWERKKQTTLTTCVEHVSVKKIHMLKELIKNIVLSISSNLTSHMVDYGVETFNAGTEHFKKSVDIVINSQLQN